MIEFFVNTKWQIVLACIPERFDIYIIAFYYKNKTSLQIIGTVFPI